MSIFKEFKDESVLENEETTDVVTSEETVDDVMIDEPVMEQDELDEVVDEELLGAVFDNSDDTVAEEPKFSRPEMTKEDKNAVTVITKGTTINGSIISDCSLDVMGTINGDIECLGKLSISGTVVGNAMASEIYINTDRLEGNLTSDGSVKIGLGTVVVGDVTGNSAVIAGAVKGEIDINGPVVIDSTAIIKGNVKAKSIQMNNGAVLEGFCSLTSYASLDIDNVFE